MVYEADLFPPIGGSVKIEEMEAGPALDALIAEKVMGWKPPDPSLHLGKVELLESFSTDIAAAWRVVEKLQPVIGHIYPSHDFETGRFEHWVAVVETEYGNAESDHPVLSQRFGVLADTAPLAICRAALRFVGAKP